MAVGQFTLAEAAKLLNEASVSRKIAVEYAEMTERPLWSPEDLAQHLNERAHSLEEQAVKLLTGGLT